MLSRRGNPRIRPQTQGIHQVQRWQEVSKCTSGVWDPLLPFARAAVCLWERHFSSLPGTQVPRHMQELMTWKTYPMFSNVIRLCMWSSFEKEKALPNLKAVAILTLPFLQIETKRIPNDFSHLLQSFTVQRVQRSAWNIPWDSGECGHKFLSCTPLCTVTKYKLMGYCVKTWPKLCLP